MTQFAGPTALDSSGKPLPEDSKDAVRGSGSRVVAWCKRLGFFGFMFFLIKGLLWLAVPAFLANRLVD